MKIRNLAHCILLLALAVMVAGCSASLGVRELKGTVQVSRTDDDDRAIEGFIFDGKEEFHLVEGSAKNKLLDQVDAKVRVRGEITESWFSGKKYIDIDSYKIIERVN